MAGRFDEVPIEIAGKRYRFYLGHYGLKALERSVGQPWPKIFQQGTGDMSAFVSLALPIFHAGLVFHHEDMTERQASLLLDEIGIDRFVAIFSEAVKGILVSDEPANTGADSARPPQPAAAANGSGIAPSTNG